MSCWFDSLHLENCLGLGSFGLVFKAVSKSNPSQTFAVKIIFLDESTEDETRILREYELLQGKTHPNIVSAVNLIQKDFGLIELNQLFGNQGQNDDKRARRMKSFYTNVYSQVFEVGELRALCLKMELCGETLRQWVNHYSAQIEPELRESLSWNMTFLQSQFSITSGLLDGIKFLHGHKIIHRDFKPENVMFSKEGYTLPIKIGDFGLCRQIHGDESCTGDLTSNQGSLAYRAPEMNSNAYGYPADLYALGLVFLEVLQLVAYSNRNSLVDRIVNDNETDLILKHHLIPNAKEVITRLTKKKTALRFTSAEEVSLITSSFLNVFTSSDLSSCFTHCTDGDRILLNSGVYVGLFRLHDKNDILIKGVDSDHVLIRPPPLAGRGVALRIAGNSCTLQNISINSDQMGWCIVFKGDSNLVSNITVKECKNGVQLVGRGNTATNLTINSATFTGISIQGDENIVERLTCTSGYSGVLIHGSGTQVKDIVLVAARMATTMQMGYSGVRQGLGSGTLVDGLICSISKRPFSEWAFSCFDATVRGVVLRNVDCHYICINGIGHTLDSVVCKKVLRIYGHSHSLKGVSGERCEILEEAGSLVMGKCKFKRIIYKKEDNPRWKWIRNTFKTCN